MQNASPDPDDGTPWGRAAGFLGACGVILIGVVCGLEPEVILVRAVGAGLATGLIAATARWAVYRFLISQ
jgi:hypothetical protein